MTFEPFQPSEDEDHILVAILDDTYGESSDEEWGAAREVFRRDLEKEFSLPFADADIGPGASLPAFATLIEAAIVPASAAFALICAGKPFQEGLDAYLKMAARLRKFFGHRVFLSRQGAAALAIEAVVRELDGVPRSIVLIGYQPQHVSDPDDLAAVPPIMEIHEGPGTLYLGAVRHLFEINADGAVFRVGVEGQTVKTLRVRTALASASPPPLTDDRR